MGVQASAWGLDGLGISDVKILMGPDGYPPVDGFSTLNLLGLLLAQKPNSAFSKHYTLYWVVVEELKLSYRIKGMGFRFWFRTLD